MPHQRVALDRAKDALDTIRPHASTNLGTAFERQPELIRAAAEGRGQAALRAMQLEAEIRIDPFCHFLRLSMQGALQAGS